MADIKPNPNPIYAQIYSNAADFKKLTNRWIQEYMELGEITEKLDKEREEIMAMMRKSLTKMKN